MRRQQEIELPELRNGDPREILAWLGHRLSILHVPGVVAADDGDLLLLTLERRATAPARRIVSLSAGELLARGLGVVIDGACVARHLEPRPIRLRTEALTHGGVPAGSGDLNRFWSTHGPGSGLQDRLGILG